MIQKKKVLVIETLREGYSPEQCRETLTAGEMKAVLDNYDDDTPIYSYLGDGYVYGSIQLNCFKLID